jgi:glycosyltransferase involved in cell wall biosynthesis
MKRIAVITPTVGTHYLTDAIHSVGMQAEHWIVVDGIAYVQPVVSRLEAHPYRQKLIILPENTGTPTQGFNGMPYTGFFNGYRVNAAIPLITNADYVMFLDEDNWFEPEHIPSMVKCLEDNDLDWCYSLRKVVDKEGNFLFNDNCDSLGEFPNYYDGAKFVDMNCYLFKNCVISRIALSMYDLADPFLGDKLLYKEASTKYPNFAGTGLYTVNYRMTRDAQVDYYSTGNEIMSKRYSSFPWSKV